MTPKEAVERARELLDLKWTHDDQVEKAVKVVESLAQQMSSPAGFLSMVQVLWLPDAASGVLERPSIKNALTIFRQSMPTLVQRETSLGWAQTVVWAACRCRIVSDWQTAAGFCLLRSVSEWSSMQERQKELLKEVIAISQEESERAYASVGADDYKPFRNWPAVPLPADSKTWPDIQQQIGSSPTIPTLTAAFTTLHGRACTRIEDLDATAKALTQAVQQLEEHISSEGTLPATARDELNLLWWGQSLYSLNLRESYRDIPAEYLAFWMAEDMSQLAEAWPAEAKVAYCTESLRKVLPEIDKAITIREHADRLLNAIRWASEQSSKAKPREAPAELASLVEREATGLPITLLVEGARHGKDPKALFARLETEVGMNLGQEVSCRKWAGWIYRERLLARFLDGAASNSAE